MARRGDGVMIGETTTGLDRGAVDRLIDEHFRAEEAEDVEAIAATFTEDAEHDGDSTQQLFGREAISKFYSDLYRVVSQHRFTTVRRARSYTSNRSSRLARSCRCGARQWNRMPCGPP